MEYKHSEITEQIIQAFYRTYNNKSPDMKWDCY